MLFPHVACLNLDEAAVLCFKKEHYLRLMPFASFSRDVTFNKIISPLSKLFSLFRNKEMGQLPELESNYQPRDFKCIKLSKLLMCIRRSIDCHVYNNLHNLKEYLIVK